MDWARTPPARRSRIPCTNPRQRVPFGHTGSRPQRGRGRVGACRYGLGARASGAPVSPPLYQPAPAGSIRRRWFPPPEGYALPTCHAALGRAARAPRGGSPWCRLPACVQASSPPPAGVAVAVGVQASRLRHARDRHLALLPRVSGDEVPFWSKCDSADGQTSQICAAHPSFPWPAQQPLPPARDRKHGWRGSMAAALQTARHAHNGRVRQPIQHVLARLERRTATGPVAHNST